MSKQLDFIRRGGVTRRFHTERVLHHQNVAEHSHGVAMICAWLADDAISTALIMSALCHDLAEHIMGDVPAPSKRGLPAYTGDTTRSFKEVFEELESDLLREVDLHFEDHLTATEKRWLKLADAAECGFFCVRERELGNRTLGDVFSNVIQYMNEIIYAAPPPARSRREEQLRQYLLHIWERANEHG